MEPIRTVSIDGKQFVLGNRGLVSYEGSIDFKRPFKSRVQESVAAFEARIAD